MNERAIRWTHVLHLGDDRRGVSRHGLALVVAPPELAHGIASLIKVSGEYRDVGLLVTNVGPNSQAANARIERGDVLLRYDGVPLEKAEQLKSLEGVPAQGEAHRQVALEAVRGARELTLAVPAGHLGITVSALLHRIGSARRPQAGVIWASRDDDRADAGEQRLVEVPDALVPQVRLLAEVLLRPANAKQRKKATALVVTAAGIG